MVDVTGGKFPFLGIQEACLSPYPVRQSSLKNNTSPGLVIHSLAALGKSPPLLSAWLAVAAQMLRFSDVVHWDGIWVEGGALAHIMSQACEEYREREDDCKTATDTIPALERKYNTLRWLLFVRMPGHVRFRNPMDCSPPDSSVPGIPQARILEWVAISFSRSPRPWV